MTFKLVNGRLFDADGVALLPDQTFKSTDDALALLLTIGMSDVMVHE